VLLEKDGELVTYAWYLPKGRMVSNWIWIVPRPRELASVGYQVLPKFRGQRIYQKTLNFSCSQLYSEGYSGFVSFAEVLNRSTMRAGEAGRNGSGPQALSRPRPNIRFLSAQ